MTRLRPLFCLPALLLASAFSLAQPAGPNTSAFDADPFTANPAQLRAASAAVPPSSQHRAQILYEEGNYLIAADGTLTYRHRLVYRVDNPDAVAGWSEISANWDPWYEKPAQLQARVLQAGDRFATLDPKTITDAPVKADDSETFSSEHVRRAPLPGVTVGAIVEEVETTEEKTPYFKDGSLYGYQLEENMPVARMKVVVDLPLAMPFKDAITLAPALKVTRTESAGRRHVVYELADLPAEHDSDIDLSTNHPLHPRIDFSTGASWESVAAGYATLSDPQTVAEDAKPFLPANLPVERMARITAVVQKLHREVRYTGVEFGSAKLTPVRPSQVIERHYGDCKDKATLLVAMLRAGGIPANLALLDTGPGRDVSVDMPGMNRFDHAIVYVPAAGTEPALWIDATANFNEVGTLPYDDQGRMALIIAPGTKSLTMIPPPAPGDSVLEETRTFTLPSLGLAHVEERSKTHGYIDASYRSQYGAPDTAKTREDMERYIDSAYLAKKLTSINHGDGSDLEHPFVLTIIADQARRGATSFTDGIVVVFPNGATRSLPKWFSEAPPIVGPETTAEARADLDLQVKHRAESYTFRPFIQDQKTRVPVPAGFAVRSLPANKVTPLGTATLTETYAQEGDVVIADLHFDSGPDTLTVDQALAMRTAVLELNKREYVGLYFDQVGAKELAAGHIRRALEADRAAIAAHPEEALGHARLARALLEAGIGDAAQKEARKATVLDPKSAPAYLTLGWTLEHDSLGERWGKGYDRAGALGAYHHAAELNPNDNDANYSAAILCEFDARGIRYAPDANMAEAIKLYRALVEKTKDKEPAQATQYRANLLFALLFAKHYVELDAELAKLPINNTNSTLAISSAAAQHGAAAGIAQAEKGNVATSDRNKNLRTAGGQLARLHLYGEAADVMAAGIAGDDAPQIAREIEMYRTLKTASMAPLPPTNPASPVQRITVGVMDGTLTREQAEASLSAQAYASKEAMDRDVRKNLTQEGFLRAVADKSGLSESVLLDVIAGNMTWTSTGDDAAGFSITGQAPGAEPSRYFVVKEQGTYRVIADEHDDAQVGTAVLYALAHDKPAEAKALLDWKRDFTHKGGSDDAFAGPLLPRFWTIGSTKPGAAGPEAMRLAGIALLSGSMSAKPYLAEVSAARDKAPEAHRVDYDVLLAEVGVGAEAPDIALPAALRLLEAEPDSLTALRMAGQAYAEKGDAASWQALLAPRLKGKPADHDLLAEQSRAYALAKDYALAQATSQKVLDSGKADASDYNSYAWLGLFRQKDLAQPLDDAATKAAQQSNMLSKNASFADLHTLACVYAADGRTTEARQVLAQAMYAGNQSEPNSAVWYALGLIYEQYGEKDAALAAYRKVQEHEEDDHTYVDATSTYLLAKGRIVALRG